MFSEKMNSLAWHCQEEIRIEFCEEMAWELATSQIEMQEKWPLEVLGEDVGWILSS
jgi:hypothetical protein